MEDQLVSYKTAVLAKEKEFNWEVRNSFSVNTEFNHHIIDEDYLDDWNSLNAVSAPTQSLLGRWLREKHNCYVEIRWHSPLDGSDVTSDNIRFVFEINYYGKDFNIPYTDDEDLLVSDFMTYEEALEEGLYQALLLIK